MSAPPRALEPSPVEDIANYAGTNESDWTTRHLLILEANIDDMTGEVAGYLTEKLLDEGSLDAWVTPIFMKKSRPAYTVHVLCEPRDQDRFMQLLFVESTTLGVRKRSVERCSLRRKTVTASTAVGDVRVKASNLCFVHSEVVVVSLFAVYAVLLYSLNIRSASTICCVRHTQ